MAILFAFGIALVICGVVVGLPMGLQWLWDERLTLYASLRKWLWKKKAQSGNPYGDLIKSLRSAHYQLEMGPDKPGNAELSAQITAMIERLEARGATDVDPKEVLEQVTRQITAEDEVDLVRIAAH